MGVSCTKPSESDVAGGGGRGGSSSRGQAASSSLCQPPRGTLHVLTAPLVDAGMAPSRQLTTSDYGSVIRILTDLSGCDGKNASIGPATYEAFHTRCLAVAQGLRRQPQLQKQQQQQKHSFEEFAYAMLSPSNTGGGSNDSDDDDDDDGGDGRNTNDTAAAADTISDLFDTPTVVQFANALRHPLLSEHVYFSNSSLGVSGEGVVAEGASSHSPTTTKMKKQNSMSFENEYFVSLKERAALVDRSLTGEGYTAILRESSRTLSRLLLPIAVYVTKELSDIRSSTAGRRRHQNPRSRHSRDDEDNDEGGDSTVADRVERSLRRLIEQQKDKSCWRSSMQILQTTSVVECIQKMVSTLSKLLYVAGGGWASIGADDRRVDMHEDVLLAEVLQSEGVSLVVGSLTRAIGFDGFKGMHTAEEVESWVATLQHVFCLVGLMPTEENEGRQDRRKMGRSSRPTLQEWWRDTFLSTFPHYLLSEDAKQTALYLHGVLLGQKKLHLQPIMRSDVLRSVAKEVLQSGVVSNAQASIDQEVDETFFRDLIACPSFRLFPVFATEGVGLESGEGHGPRKELFDLSAMEMTAPRTQPIDITSAATMQLVSNVREVHSQRLATGVSICQNLLGKPVLLVSWRQRKLVSSFQQGDVIIVTLEKREGSGQYPERSDSTTSSTNSSSQRHSELRLTTQNECWTVEGTLEASQPYESIIVLNTMQARIPWGYRVVSCKVESKRNPPFKHESGNAFAWLNPTYQQVANATIRRRKQQGAQQQQHSSQPSSSDAMDLLPPYLTLFACGWLTANAPPNGLVSPSTIPPFVFRYMRHMMMTSTSSSLSYRPIAADLSLVNHSLVSSIEETLKMDDKTFKDVLLADGLPATTTKADYVDQVMVLDTLWNSGDHDESRAMLHHFAVGFLSSPLRDASLLFLGSCSKQLRSMFCGTIDEGISDFSFQEHFRVVEDLSDAARFEYCEAFREIFWDVMEHGFDPPTKRQLLKFITGRTLLPPRKKAEHIKVEFPLSPMNAQEFDRAMTRLPSSHSCDNVVEIINILECMLFGSQSAFYSRSGKTVGCVILDDRKKEAWSLFSVDERASMVVKAKKVLKEQLRKAVTLSGTYELDDGAVSKGTRDAFEAAFAGSISMASRGDESASTPIRSFGGGGGGGAGSGSRRMSFEQPQPPPSFQQQQQQSLYHSGSFPSLSPAAASSPYNAGGGAAVGRTSALDRIRGGAAGGMVLVDDFDDDDSPAEHTHPYSSPAPAAPGIQSGSQHTTPKGKFPPPPHSSYYGAGGTGSLGDAGVLLPHGGGTNNRGSVVGNSATGVLGTVPSSHTLNQTRGSTTASSAHHLGIFDTRKNNATDFDDDIVAVDVDDDMVGATSVTPSRPAPSLTRGNSTSSAAATPQPTLPKKRAEDIDGLMSELYPRKF